MDEENENIIIIDNGTSLSKISFGGGNPHIVPTCIGYEKPKHEQSSFYWNMSDYYKSINKNYSYPIKNGIITDFDKIKEFYYNIFDNHLRIEPKNCKLFVTQ